jgi:predicted Zn finger-like uncharacterized protein
MPETIHCPECSRKLRVPDHLLGKKVKCPSCSAIFTAEAPEQPPEPVQPRAARRRPTPPLDEEEDEEEQPPPRRRKPPPPVEEEYEEETEEEEEDQEPEEEESPEEEERPRRRRIKTDWPKIRTGVDLALISVSIMLLAIPVSGVAGVMEAQQAPPNLGPGAFQRRADVLPLPFWIGAMAGLVSDIVALVSYFFCMAAPTKQSAKTLATACLVLGGIVLVGTIAVFAVTITKGPSPVLELVRVLFVLSKFFLFLFFLRAIARLLREDGVERSVKYLLIVYGAFLTGLVVLAVIVLIVVVGAVGAMAAQQQAGNPQAAPNVAAGIAGGFLLVAGCGCFDIVLGLTSLVWYIVALVQTHNAITRYIEG